MSKIDKAIRENQKMNPKDTNRNILTASEKEVMKAKKKIKKKVAAMMAFAAGKAAAEPIEIKRYIGVAGCYIVGICPTKDELTKIYGRTSENDPVYLGEYEIPSGKVPQARIDVALKVDGERHLDTEGKPINFIVRKSFYVAKSYRYNRDQSKLQVIDKYGRTAWVTEAQLATHEIPMYKNGLANLDKDYRPTYIGEDILTDFMIAYLNIPNVMKFDREANKWYMVENPEECEARLEHIDNIFKGDFSEIRNAVATQPINKVKALIGVKSSNGRMYQDVFDTFMKYGATNYSKLQSELDNRKAQGGYANTEFRVGELCEYKVTPTNIELAPAAKNPFETDEF